MDTKVVKLVNPTLYRTHDSCHYLAEYNYVAGPKADNKSMLLFYQRRGLNNRRIYLVSPTQVDNMMMHRYLDVIIIH